MWSKLQQRLINSKYYYFHTENGVLLCGDCLEVMKLIPKESVDAIITDPPYGLVKCKWDVIIPFEDMWRELKRIRKDRTPIVLFGSEPFSSYLRISNIKEYKYDWIWKKSRGTNFALFKYQPARNYEILSVFGKKSPNYYPIMDKRPEKNKRKNKPRVNKNTLTDSEWLCKYSKGNDNFKFPEAIREFTEVRCGLHPTQKPLALLEYLVKTYTNEGDLVLDFTCGSGTTLLACEKLNRRWIGIEINPEYCEISKERIQKVLIASKNL